MGGKWLLRLQTRQGRQGGEARRDYSSIMHAAGHGEGRHALRLGTTGHACNREGLRGLRARGLAGLP